MRRLNRLPLLIATLTLGCVGVASAQVSTDDVRQAARERVYGSLADQEQQAYARSLLVQFETRVKQTESLIQQVEQRNAAYREQMDTLLTNEDGKRLGRKGMSVAMHFMGYQEQPLVEPSELAAKKAFVEQMLAFLERAKSGPDGYVPQPERVEEADDAYLWARSRAMKLSETESWLKENLASLDRSEDVSTDPTLERRIDVYRADLRQAWIDAQTRGRQAAREAAEPVMEQNARTAELERALLEANQKLALARQQNEQQRIDFEMRMERQRIELRERLAASQREMDDRLAEIERQNKLAEAERMRRDAQAGAEAQGIQQDARRVELVAKCNSPEVQNALAPFLAEGLWQPGDLKRNIRFEKAPMSLSKIRSDGALVDDINGYQRLLEIANAQGCFPRGGRNSGYYVNREHLDSDRPKWGYPQYWKNLSTEQIQEVRRIQSLLNELGPTLVDEGMLTP